MPRKTRFEQNQDLLEKQSATFIPHLAEQFKCVFRAKKRGEGVMIDKDHLKEIEEELFQISRKVSEQARKDALTDLGIEFEYFHQYRNANPDNLSEDALNAKRSEYFDKEWERKRVLRHEAIPSLGDRPLCLALGEEVKSHESRSFMSIKTTMGIQTSFLPDWSQTDLIAAGNTFSAISRGGSPPFRSVRQISSIEALYASPAQIIKSHVTTNIGICKILADPPKVCKVFPKLLVTLEAKIAESE